MCNDIMSLSNTIIYEGRLKSGSEEVGNQSLHVPYPENLTPCINEVLINESNNWMKSVLDPNRRVIFLNHDEVEDCKELSNRENIQNPKEAEIIRQIVEAMILCGVKPSQVGVMSFYRAQLRLFHKIFADRQDIEKLTADQFQGRDKDCVIISLVKSNDSKDPGSLLKEWRRVNVAITRAKSKLILVGSKSTLQSLKTIDAFMNILASRGWFYNLPAKADLLYSLNAPSTHPRSKDSPRKATKPIADSKALNNKPLTRDIAREMGL
jgi:DNA replication ATP-dependent helicase Dna2